MPGIWMLAKSEDVSCQFQMLATAVAVVLDVILPLEEMDVSVEVKQVAGGVCENANELLDNVASTQINGGGSSNADRVIEFLNLDDFRAGNSTCPKTGERLTSIDLVPNLALKFLIKQYCYVKGIPFVETGRQNRDTVKSVATGSVANEQATKLLEIFLVGQTSCWNNETAK
ncbi:hypothetical protein CQW23_25081 [Capsicum baccatum]|uniref:U-box domain-containing protein n=1 Tax=Capsicum baccatum TaxID=33114 RepID=A0A2G2VJU3_CAPBA|nr:hypothetical protein CQW23_25081 [Capsicum baccatum]